MEWTFDTEAEQYEKMRPGYVPALYEDIFSYILRFKKAHYNMAERRKIEEKV